MKHLLLLLACLGIFSGCSSTSDQESFDFVFKYGVGSINEMNTLNDTFTKDLIVKPPVTTTLVLSESEIQSVQAKIEELDLMNIDTSVKPDANGLTLNVDPCENYSLYIQTKDSEATLQWDCITDLQNPQLQEFFTFMKDLIESHVEYQELPEAEGGYM